MEQKRLPIFAERFAELRGNRTQAEFADFLGLSRPTIGFYENGSRIPDALVLRQIAVTCNVSSDWLLGLTDVRAQEGGLRQACAYTGLSEFAITCILDLYKNECPSEDENDFRMADVLNCFLTNACFMPMMEDMMMYFTSAYHATIKDGMYGSSFNEPEAVELLDTLREKCGKYLHVLHQNEVPHFYRNKVQTYFNMYLDDVAAIIVDESKKITNQA